MNKNYFFLLVLFIRFHKSLFMLVVIFFNIFLFYEEEHSPFYLDLL